MYSENSRNYKYVEHGIIGRQGIEKTQSIGTYL